MHLKIIFQILKKNLKKFFFQAFLLIVLKVKKNYIFFAIKGNKIDGNNFISKVIKKGAKIIISEKKIKKVFKI